MGGRHLCFGAVRGYRCPFFRELIRLLLMDKTNAQIPASGFFLPDLCQVRAVVFLVLVAELLALVLVLAAAGLREFSWVGLAVTSMYVQWVVLLSAGILCQLRKTLSRQPLPLAATTCYLLILAVTAVVELMGQWVMQGAFSGSGQWSVDAWQLGEVLIITAVLAGIALRYFYLTAQLRIRQQAELQARIQALQSRIRPHFLFNSMNIIASLIAIDPQAAETAVEDLATLFRASLAESGAEVDIAKELELCRRYVRIEQLRMGERLQVDWQLDALPLGLRIPSLTLQPLLENAIYHGIQALPEGGVVTVTAAVVDDQLRLSVSNPVTGGAAARKDGNRVAQQNIHHRLQALYGPRAGLDSELTEQGYRATVHYPLTGRSTT